MVKLCTKRRNGSWNLTSDYLKYRNEGGLLPPQAWNQLVKEIARNNGVCIHCGNPTFVGIICEDCFLKRRYKNNPRLKKVDEENMRKLQTIAEMARK